MLRLAKRFPRETFWVRDLTTVKVLFRQTVRRTSPQRSTEDEVYQRKLRSELPTPRTTDLPGGTGNGERQ